MKHFMYIYLLLGVVGFFILESSLYDKILLFCMVSIVPLLLTIVEDSFVKSIFSKLYTILVISIPIAVISVFLIYFGQYNWVTNISAGIWILVSVFILIYGVVRILLLRRFSLNEIIISLGLISILPTSILFSAYQWGIDVSPLDKNSLPVITIHFFFILTILPVLMGITGRLINKFDTVYRIYNFNLIILIISLLLFIVNTFINNFLMYFYIGSLSISILLYLLILSFYVLPFNKKWSVILLTVSQLTILYSISTPLLNIYMEHVGYGATYNPDILIFHGLTSLFFFSFFGLFSWVYIPNSPRYGISEELFKNLSKKDLKRLKKKLKEAK